MTLFYHGTVFDFVPGIAEQQALLSPWDQRIARYKKTLARPDLLKHSPLLKNKHRLEDYALEIVSQGYGAQDIEHRVKCVSLTNDIFRAAWYARTKRLCSVIFGLELDLPAQQTIFVPRKVPLDTLKEIYVLGKGSRSVKPQLEQMFADYDPAIAFYRARKNSNRKAR